MLVFGVTAALLVVAAALGCSLWPTLRKHRREEQLAATRQSFQLRREWLEARFVTLASQSGRPRGLAWVDCEFENPVAFARDRNSNELRALVGVAIRFEAIEGGGMEHVEAVSNIRAATAVFRHDGQAWITDGRAVFNLNPAETIEHYRHELELVE